MPIPFEIDANKGRPAAKVEGDRIASQTGNGTADISRDAGLQLKL